MKIQKQVQQKKQTHQEAQERYKRQTHKKISYIKKTMEKTPMTQKIVDQKIEGAIVTAKGANDANVTTSIVQAVEAVTGLPTHKIQVFELNS